MPRIDPGGWAASLESPSIAVASSVAAATARATGWAKKGAAEIVVGEAAAAALEVRLEDGAEAA